MPGYQFLGGLSLLPYLLMHVKVLTARIERNYKNIEETVDGIMPPNHARFLGPVFL